MLKTPARYVRMVIGQDDSSPPIDVKKRTGERGWPPSLVWAKTNERERVGAHGPAGRSGHSCGVRLLPSLRGECAPRAGLASVKHRAATCSGRPRTPRVGRTVASAERGGKRVQSHRGCSDWPLHAFLLTEGSFVRNGCHPATWSSCCRCPSASPQESAIYAAIHLFWILLGLHR